MVEKLEFHKRVVMGVEIEAYSITTSRFEIGRRISKPPRALSEKGERFGRDASIGSEYNSRPFSTIREASFLLKSGLRKYLHAHYTDAEDRKESTIPLLVGGWSTRFAGTHLHLSIEGQELTIEDAKRLAAHLHDHVPLLVAVGANSPVWGNVLTPNASNRLLRGSGKYFKAMKRGQLNRQGMNELTYNRGRKRKPPTLELRFLDSNVPDFIVAALTLVKAVALNWLRRGPMRNRISHVHYLQGRAFAAERGMKAELSWNGDWLKAPKYLDRFLWEYRKELEAMDVPEDVWEIFRLLKRGYNGAQLIREAAALCIDEHPQTWERRFAKRYSKGLHHLLSGNSIWDLAEALHVELPSTDDVWLGRKAASLGD